MKKKKQYRLQSAFFEMLLYILFFCQEWKVRCHYREANLRIQYADCYGINLSKSCKKSNGLDAEKINRFVTV